MEVHKVNPQAQMRKTHHGTGVPKQRLVMVYTVVVCLSCLYLETQVSNSLASTSRTS